MHTKGNVENCIMQLPVHPFNKQLTLNNIKCNVLHSPMEDWLLMEVR